MIACVFVIFTSDIFCKISSSCVCMFGSFVMRKRYPPPPAPARQQPSLEKISHEKTGETNSI